ncbi:MAG: hypothetical protein JWM11_2843 [Planctomycetaceae bacterium]|nr:hypothetical protein [Planctomycetaceae bacterium]
MGKLPMLFDSPNDGTAIKVTKPMSYKKAQSRNTVCPISHIRPISPMISIVTVVPVSMINTL